MVQSNWNRDSNHLVLKKHTQSFMAILWGTLECSNPDFLLPSSEIVIFNLGAENWRQRIMSVGMRHALKFLLQLLTNRVEIKWLKDNVEDLNLWSKVEVWELVSYFSIFGQKGPTGLLRLLVFYVPLESAAWLLDLRHLSHLTATWWIFLSSLLRIFVLCQ